MAVKRLLVVEGADDLHVILHLMARRSFEPKFDVVEQKGISGLLKQIPIYLKPGTEIEKFEILVDADVNVSRRWQSIRDVLTRLGYENLPMQPDPAGTIASHEDLPRVGVWIMPDNAASGALEDFMRFLVPPGDPLIGRAQACLDGIPLADRRFAETHKAKALIHTWLAWQEDPGSPFGVAITKRYFEVDGPHVAAFLAWLTRVFA